MWGNKKHPTKGKNENLEWFPFWIGGMYLHLNKNKSSHSRLSSKPSRSSRTSSSHTGSRRNHSNNSNNSNRSNSNNSSGSQILEISEQYNGTRIDKFIDEDEFELIYEPQAKRLLWRISDSLFIPWYACTETIVSTKLIHFYLYELHGMTVRLYADKSK